LCHLLPDAGHGTILTFTNHSSINDAARLHAPLRPRGHLGGGKFLPWVARCPRWIMLTRLSVPPSDSVLWASTGLDPPSRPRASCNNKGRVWRERRRNARCLLRLRTWRWWRRGPREKGPWRSRPRATSGPRWRPWGPCWRRRSASPPSCTRWTWFALCRCVGGALPVGDESSPCGFVHALPALPPPVPLPS